MFNDSILASDENSENLIEHERKHNEYFTNMMELLAAMVIVSVQDCWYILVLVAIHIKYHRIFTPHTIYLYIEDEYCRTDEISTEKWKTKIILPVY